MGGDFIINLLYLIGAVAFVWGLRLLGSPDTARRGNTYAAIGMGLAIIGALIQPVENGGNNNYGWIVGGMIAGAVIGFSVA